MAEEMPEYEGNKDKQRTLISPITFEGLCSVTRQIVQQFDPHKVILFGSYAYGQPTPDSDVDLLVLMDTDEPPLHVAAKIAAMIEHPFPLDIVVRTPAEIRLGCSTASGICYRSSNERGHAI
jgi:predicted nucleotidyltransferase